MSRTEYHIPPLSRIAGFFVFAGFLPFKITAINVQNVAYSHHGSFPYLPFKGNNFRFVSLVSQSRSLSPERYRSQWV